MGAAPPVLPPATVCRGAQRKYATDLTALEAANISVEGVAFKPSMQVTDSLYEISAPGFNGAIVRIRQDGKVWVSPANQPGTQPSR